MKRLIAVLVLLAMMGILLLVNAESHPEWLRSLGVDWWGLADVRDAQRAEERREHEVAEGLTAAAARLRSRRHIVQALLADRIDLFTAAARFHALNQQNPPGARAVASWHPEMAPGELACRHLLRWIKEDNLDTEAWPAYREMLARLEAQLESHLRVHGQVVLPAGSW
jgi:hypothetical protein